MGLFQKRHKFKKSPLSLSVPLDGCDSVIGLQELQRRKDSDVLAKAFNLSSSSKPSQRRHKGRSLWDVTWADAKSEPRPWLHYFWGADWGSYNLCEGLTHLGERAEENLVHYLPNYSRIFLGFVILIMLLRPWSILGVALLAFVALLSPILEIHSREKQLPFKQQRHLTFRQLVWEAVQTRASQVQAAVYRAQLQQEAQAQQSSGQALEGQLPGGERGEETAQNWGFVVSTFILFFTGLPGVLARASMYTACVVLGHCSFRQSPSEWAVAVRKGGQDGGAASLGVPFLEVFGLRKSKNTDPRRLIKESWATLISIASAAGIYIWHAAQSKCSNSLRYFRA